ncbi:hypothetical protein ABPG77_003127 [Micractinium sp. CCAP 211/92]
MAQLCCSNAQCRVVLLYPRGAGQVQCSVCGNLNDATQANQLGHIVCGGCAVTLAYAFGAQSVKCSVCGFVTPATEQSCTTLAAQQARPPMPGQLQQAGSPDAQQQAATQQASSVAGSKPNSTTVLVVNPGDEGGNDVSAPAAPSM